MSGTQRLLDDGTVATGVVIFNQDGSIAGEDPSSTRVTVLGRCSDVDNILRSVWDGPTALYVAPTAPIQMQVVSTSAADASTGTGIRKIEIYYLDTNYNQKIEILALTGVTPVLTVATNILRVNNVRATETGTGLVAAGTISLQAVGGAVTYGLISVGRNMSRTGIYTVPDGYKFKIDQWQLSTGAVTGSHFTQMTLLSTSADGVLAPGLLIPIDEQGTLNNGLVINYSSPITLPPRTDISMAVISDSSSANVVALGTFMGTLQAV
jgi:hypothetical protein